MITIEEQKNLIGKECVYGINDKWVHCVIRDIFLEREDKWPYTCYVSVAIWPLCTDELTEGEIEEIQDGVPLYSLYDIEWE